MSKKIKKWGVLKTKDISPAPYFPLFVDNVKLPHSGKEIEYYRSELGDVAMVVAITKNREVIFARQYKHGVQEITHELPAGRIGKRRPEQAAREELEQETGIVAKELIPIGEVFVAPSKDSTHTYGYLVTDAEVTGRQKLDENENIELVYVPPDKIDDLIRAGEIMSADTIAMLKLAQLKAPKVFRP
jgi:8-oxo-dGTP pyrophosphatase MutT (NUDIX family)